MRTYRSESGRGTWQLQIRDHEGRARKFSSRMSDRAQAAKMGNRIESICAARACGDKVDPRLLDWIQGSMPTWLREKLVKWGAVDSVMMGAAEDLESSIVMWAMSLENRNNRPQYVQMSRSRVTRLVAGLKLSRYGELEDEKLMALLARWGREGMSLATRQHYLQALKTFAAWMVGTGRASISPIRHLSLERRAEAELRVRRRPLTPAEFRQLYEAVKGMGRLRKQQSAMEGADRAMLYWVAVCTGFRLSELRGLLAASFRLHQDPPVVVCDAAYAKNARARSVPLPRELCDALEEYLEDRKPGEWAFPLPSHGSVGRRFKEDLVAAGLARQDGPKIRTTNDLGEVVDFHALRHTAITWWLDEYELSARKVQDLAGLSSIQLVSRYSRRFHHHDFSWLQRAPSIRDDSPPTAPHRPTPTLPWAKIAHP